MDHDALHDVRPVTTRLVDPRDMTHEVTAPVFRVTFWTGERHDDDGTPASQEATYELEGVDVVEAIAWTRAHARTVSPLVLVQLAVVADDPRTDGRTAISLWSWDGIADR
ncbi:hypothetical protein ACFO3K_19085 [Cellulomonas algicola]|uniref:hypothetical protein n=1 Tax=Cellulomonas algicola TaxID=2071633 RepID=UPI001C3FC535|nr:hypothetical protein [Cellulomonas algicola]